MGAGAAAGAAQVLETTVAASAAARQEDGGQHPRRRQRLVFLYRLVPGRAAPSFGLHCAALAGLPEGLLSRAQQASTEPCSGGGAACAFPCSCSCSCRGTACQCWCHTAQGTGVVVVWSCPGIRLGNCPRNCLMPCRAGGLARPPRHRADACLCFPPALPLSPLPPPAQIIDCQKRGEPVPAAALPGLAARSACCAQLARRLLGLSLRDGPGVTALLEAALELEGGEAQAAKA